TIEVGSGLSEEEVERMASDAEAHADEDKKRRELVDLKNQADSMVYQAEKQVKESGDKLDEESKAKIESSIADLKKAMEGEDADALKAQIATFEQAFQQAGAAMAGAAGGAPGPDAAGAATEGEAGAAQDDDIKDADFEVK
ncbi:MAG: Hsp70 family protein, partial [Planctomycetota bacterium]|nr:Hsp70 family protein [Planctomycetota bacterium]